MNFPSRSAAIAIVMSATISFPALAIEPTVELISEKFIHEIGAWAHHPVTLIAVNAQNKRHKNLTEEKIVELDKGWIAQRKNVDQPLIAQLLGSPLSTYMTRIKANSGGLITEIFVMDNKGLNVGQSSVTSDYWQGDEAKWQKTFLNGVGAVFIDKPSFDKETNTHRVQVNMTIVDGSPKTAIGAITVEVNLDELARLKSLAN